MRSSSFRRRLSLALVVFGTVFLVFPALVFYHQMKQALQSSLDEALRSVAKAELASALDDPGEPPHIHELEGYPTLDSNLEQVAWIQSADGTFVARSQRLSEAAILDVMQGVPMEEGIFTQDIQGRSFRLLVTRLEHEGETYTEVLGLSRSTLLETLASVKQRMLVVFFIWLGLLIPSSYLLSSKLTAPLTRLSEQVEGLTPGEPVALELSSPSTDQELRVLYTALNRLLERLHRLLKAQKSFISDASHEIRAPLTNLQVALDVCLRKERDAEDYREVLEVCRKEVKRLSYLAERLLTLTRLDSQQHHLEKREVDLVHLVQESVRAVLPRAQELALEIEVETGDELWLRCDPQAVRQCLDNLLDNALRHAQARTSVELRLAEVADEVRLEVSNLGSRLDPEQRLRVFERFYRGDESRERKTGGAGLGLAIVSGFVEAHGGRVGVEQTEDGENRITFWLTLPRGSWRTRGRT